MSSSGGGKGRAKRGPVTGFVAVGGPVGGSVVRHGGFRGVAAGGSPPAYPTKPIYGLIVGRLPGDPSVMASVSGSPSESASSASSASSATLAPRRADLPGARIPGPDQRGGTLSWRIGGLAGEGIDTAGDLFGLVCVREGWHVWTTRHFPSRIRGGLTTYTVRLAGHPVGAPSGVTDVMVALHGDGARPEQEAIREGGMLLFDPKAIPEPDDKGDRADVRWVPVPCTDIAKELGEKRARNTVALGASAALLGFPLGPFEEAVIERFGGKGVAGKVTEIGQVNVEALRRGAAAMEGVPRPAMPTLPDDAAGMRAKATRDDARSGRLFLAGNDAFAYGALAGGCRFYAGYPITPATTIMEYLSAHLPRFGGVAMQVEDELAAVNMAIGAGFMGARAMTATSGPGFSLMAEAMGLAGSTETPVVIVDCMRPGPSTGMPTKTGQEDLAFAVAGGHGEEPKIVLVAEDLDGAFRIGHEAFDLAERYQCPVFVMLEAALSLGKGDTAPFDLDTIRIDRGKRVPHGAAPEDVPGLGAPRTGEGYARYAETPDGIPLRAVPGDVGGRHYANSTEHDTRGFTTEVPAVRTAMVDRRERKLSAIDEAHEGAVAEGDPDAPLGVVALGATVPVVREALRLAAHEGVAGELLVVRRLWPLPAKTIDEFLARHDRVVVAETNKTGQLLRILRGECAEAHRAEPLRKYDGEPFRVDGVLRALLGKEGSA